jgi:heterotetrameric sarcosine oxidase gamma subunit
MDPIPHSHPVAATRPATVPEDRLAARFARRQSPLGDRVPEGRSGGVTLTAPQPAGLAIVHGVSPDEDAGASSVLPLGPARWLVVHESLPGGETPVDRHGGVEVADDVSHAFACIRVAGDDARLVLATGVAIDLHPGAFPVGASAATAYREVFVVLHAVEDDTVDVYVLRSFARSLCRWLHAAAEA